MIFFDTAARAARLLPAEAAHRATIEGLKSGLVKPSVDLDDPRLAVTLKRSGLKLLNPVGLAAGFDKNAEVFAQMLAFGFGFVECGTVTPRPQQGNPRPRLFRLSEDRAVINRMGFNNDGVGVFVRRLAAAPRELGVVGANVGANKDSADRIQDYVAGLKAVWPYCAYLTINISSPNTPGLRGLQDRGALEELLGRTGEAALEMERAVKNRPVFLKVAPDLDDRAIADMADAARKAPYLHGLIVSNTTVERPVTLASRHGGEAGGLSGAPLMERSTAVLRAFAGELRGELDLIGAGGIASGADAWRKIRAGAQAVQLYSALVYGGPGLVKRIKSELAAIMAAEGVERIVDAVGVER
ncbi:MAG: quinone-dependent dihydroorotate dehydrogenase [Alphaproteobacteria bacterium]|nr:quinone-dependent dihydroorotate dehydrogenase [Alphaproteobacteria bacterium]